MNPALREFYSGPFRKLTAAAFVCALCGASGLAQAQFLLFGGPGAGQIIPSTAPLTPGEVDCPATHYHGPLPFPGGTAFPGPHCGHGKVMPFVGGSMINLNTPGGSMIQGGEQILEIRGEVGGPVVKDRFWFWGSANRNRIEQIAEGIDTKSEGARLDSESRSRFKLAENDSPRPQDRFSFSYNFFEPVSGLGSSLTPPGAPGTDLKREIVGFERTFLDGPNSIGIRLPFTQIQGVQVITDGFGPAVNPGIPIQLFPFVTNQAGFDTGLAIQNTASDPFGTKPPASDPPTKPPGDTQFKFTTFVVIDIPGSNPLALGIPIDAPPPREFVQPPVEDLDAKARAELQKEVQRMSPEDRQKALDNPLASPELKQAVLIENLRSIGSGVTATDAFRNPRDFRIGARLIF